MYYPDFYTILKITGDDPHYRVFGSWSGGYTDSDHWRMNSGIVRAEDDGDYWLFYGHSGSVYKCRRDSYGANAYGYGVMQDYIQRSDGRIAAMEDQVWSTVDWIIK